MCGASQHRSISKPLMLGVASLVANLLVVQVFNPETISSSLVDALDAIDWEAPHTGEDENPVRT